MIITTDPADAAGDEGSITRILAPHKNTVAAKYRGSTMAFDNFAIVEVDLSETSQAPYNSSNRVPVHFNKIRTFFRNSRLVQFWISQDSRLLATFAAPSRGCADASQAKTLDSLQLVMYSSIRFGEHMRTVPQRVRVKHQWGQPI